MLADLQARADDGDADAATRLYRDLHRCAAVRDANRTVPIAAQHFLNEKADKMSAEELKSMNVMLGMLDERLKFARENAVLCDGIEPTDLDALVPTTLQAALLGDDKAANCYLGSNLTLEPGLLDHPEWLVDFKQNALRIADTEVERGDWTAVKQLAFAYKGSFSGNLLSQATGLDTLQAYRYLKLWRLGAEAGKSTEYLDTELVTAAKQLAPDAISSGDAWAQETYRRNFSGVPVDPKGSINVCQLKDM